MPCTEHQIELVEQHFRAPDFFFCSIHWIDESWPFFFSLVLPNDSIVPNKIIQFFLFGSFKKFIIDPIRLQLIHKPTEMQIIITIM